MDRVMKERPILFSGPMVRAILEGRKTQTRRVCKLQPHEAAGMTWWPDGHGTDTGTGGGAPGCYLKLCPYGQPGDRLWVREAFRFLDSFDGDSPSRVGDMCLIAGYLKPWAPTQYEADGGRGNWMNVGTVPGSITAGKLRPSIHMPRWSSRIMLEIVSVRVERLQDISEADAVAEGTLVPCGGWIGGYQNLWESINGPGSWEANPWVWVVEFKRIDHA